MSNGLSSIDYSKVNKNIKSLTASLELITKFVSSSDEDGDQIIASLRRLYEQSCNDLCDLQNCNGLGEREIEKIEEFHYSLEGMLNVMGDFLFMDDSKPSVPSHGSNRMWDEKQFIRALKTLAEILKSSSKGNDSLNIPHSSAIRANGLFERIMGHFPQFKALENNLKKQKKEEKKCYSKDFPRINSEFLRNAEKICVYMQFFYQKYHAGASLKEKKFELPTSVSPWILSDFEKNFDKKIFDISTPLSPWNYEQFKNNWPKINPLSDLANTSWDLTDFIDDKIDDLSLEFFSENRMLLEEEGGFSALNPNDEAEIFTRILLSLRHLEKLDKKAFDPKNIVDVRSLERVFFLTDFALKKHSALFEKFSVNMPKRHFSLPLWDCETFEYFLNKFKESKFPDNLYFLKQIILHVPDLEKVEDTADFHSPECYRNIKELFNEWKKKIDEDNKEWKDFFPKDCPTIKKFENPSATPFVEEGINSLEAKVEPKSLLHSIISPVTNAASYAGGAIFGTIDYAKGKFHSKEEPTGNAEPNQQVVRPSQSLDDKQSDATSVEDSSTSVESENEEDNSHTPVENEVAEQIIVTPEETLLKALNIDGDSRISLKIEKKDGSNLNLFHQLLSLAGTILKTNEGGLLPETLFNPQENQLEQIKTMDKEEEKIWSLMTSSGLRPCTSMGKTGKKPTLSYPFSMDKLKEKLHWEFDFHGVLLQDTEAPGLAFLVFRKDKTSLFFAHLNEKDNATSCYLFNCTLADSEDYINRIVPFLSRALINFGVNEKSNLQPYYFIKQ